MEPQALGIYLSPDQARAVLEHASSRAPAETVQEDWANPFAFFFPEDASLADVHRVAYTAFVHAPADGAELAYGCHEAACVNPGHARELPLPGETRWICGVVEKVTCRPDRLELHVSINGNGSRRVFVDDAFLDRYGFADASSLAERVVFFTRPDDQGWVRLLPVQRRADYRDGSAAVGWLHPVGAVTNDQDCPCGSAKDVQRMPRGDDPCWRPSSSILTGSIQSTGGATVPGRLQDVARSCSLSASVFRQPAYR